MLYRNDKLFPVRCVYNFVEYIHLPRMTSAYAHRGIVFSDSEFEFMGQNKQDSSLASRQKNTNLNLSSERPDEFLWFIYEHLPAF